MASCGLRLFPCHDSPAKSIRRRCGSFSLLRSTAFSLLSLFISRCCRLLLALSFFSSLGTFALSGTGNAVFLPVKLSLFISHCYNLLSIFCYCRWFLHSLYFFFDITATLQFSIMDQPGRFLSWVRPCMAGVCFTFLSFCAILFCWRGVLAWPRAASSFLSLERPSIWYGSGSVRGAHSGKVVTHVFSYISILSIFSPFSPKVSILAFLAQVFPRGVGVFAAMQQRSHVEKMH